MHEALRIDIRRSCVVEDALNAAAKRKFDPSKTLKVFFQNVLISDSWNLAFPAQ